MPTTEPDPRLLRVAEAVADGQPVDWPGAIARDPELARELNGLHLIGRVAEVYRAAPDGEGSGGTTVTAPAAALPTMGLLRAAAAGRWFRILLVTLAGALLCAAIWFVLRR